MIGIVAQAGLSCALSAKLAEVGWGDPLSAEVLQEAGVGLSWSDGLRFRS